MTRMLCAFAVALTLLGPPSTAVAQDSDRWVPAGWEISPFIGIFDDRPEFHPNGSSSVFVDPDGNIYGGAHLGYNFGSGLFVDVEGGYFPLDMRLDNGGVVDLDLILYSAGLGYNVPLTSKVQAYGVAGVGASLWKPEGMASETDLTLNYGAGARIMVTPRFAVRAEARMHQSPDALKNTAETLAGAALASETFWGWGFTLGASVFVGGGKTQDTDGDGVADGDDACPATPRGATVDARGCALDTDGDGVADHADQCPGTPRGARVDGNGCPTDGDNDGVFDGLDRCPNTRAGARVDANGCATDADRDGVPDGIDRCPNTPAGAQVDANGCTVEPEPEPEAQPEPTITFEHVRFRLNSAEITPEAASTLQGAGRVLSTRVDDAVEIVGHTDSTGEEDYNMALSVRRAEAVRDYLLANFPRLNAGRIEIRGAGETQPVGDNATAEGRRQNRRVVIVVEGGE